MPASFEPTVPQMVVLAAVEDIHPARAPGAGGWSGGQHAAQILLGMPASFEPTVPQMVVLAAVEDIHPARAPGAGGWSGGQHAAQILLIAPWARGLCD